MIDHTKIIQHKIDHPDATTPSIARIFSTSRQHISNVISKARKNGLVIPEFTGKVKKEYRAICKYCNKEVVSIGNKLLSHRICFYTYIGYVQLKCPVCNTPFPVLKSQYRYRLEHGQKEFYDTRECLFKSLRR